PAERESKRQSQILAIKTSANRHDQRPGRPMRFRGSSPAPHPAYMIHGIIYGNALSRGQRPGTQSDTGPMTVIYLRVHAPPIQRAARNRQKWQGKVRRGGRFGNDARGFQPGKGARMKGQRTAYAIHSWTGLLTGWLLFAICLTGTLVVYKFPLKALSNPEIARVEAPDRLGPDGALRAFEAAMPDRQVRVVAFPSDIYSIHQYSVVAAAADGKENRYWISPETGEIRAELQSDFAD